MSDFTPHPGDWPSGDTPDERNLARYNKARASRGLRSLSIDERRRRDALVTRYADLPAGDERDRVALDIDALDRPEAATKIRRAARPQQFADAEPQTDSGG